MISSPDRQNAVSLIDAAITAGARQFMACRTLKLSPRTYRRWTVADDVRGDQRPFADRPEPSNKLTQEERQAVLDICNREEFASLPPSQIVPLLADQGKYMASESSFYRILRAADQQHHRGRAKAPTRRKPKS